MATPVKQTKIRSIYENAVMEIWGCCTLLVVGYLPWENLLTVISCMCLPIGLLGCLLNSSDFQQQFNASFVINLDLL